MTQARKRRSTSTFKLYYHLVFATKWRRQVLTDAIKNEVEQIILKICIDKGYRVMSYAVQPEHIHLLLRLTPTDYLPEVVNQIKGASAYQLLKLYPELADNTAAKRSLWADGYWISTVGRVKTDTLKRYHRRQDEHHKKGTSRLL